MNFFFYIWLFLVVGFILWACIDYLLREAGDWMEELLQPQRRNNHVTKNDSDT